jgi:hypothetical protein
MRRIPTRRGVFVVGLALVVALAGVAIAQPTGGGGAAPTGGTGSASTDDGGAVASTDATANTDDMPVPLRLRRLEQRVQALKERAWRAKARVGILKEDALGGGVGAQATIVHLNKMGSKFRLTKLVYAIDGAQVFTRTDDAAESLYKTKAFDILNGPIAPGSHTISVVAVYKGHGAGPFKYLDKYAFTAKASHSFTVEEGKTVKVEAVGYEKGGPNTPMEKRPDIKFTATAVAPAAGAAAAATPASPPTPEK